MGFERPNKPFNPIAREDARSWLTAALGSKDRMKKVFRLRADQIQPLACGYGGCIATDMITVEGRRVGFMYRERVDDAVDSGWRFLSGHESQEYMDDPANHAVYDINTIANYDPEIIPLLESAIGSAFERDPTSGEFRAVEFSPNEDE